MKKLLCIGGTLVVALAFALGTALPAEAQTGQTSTHLTLQVPGELDLGREATVDAVLLDDGGAPVPKVIVTLWASAAFFGASGQVKLAEGTTDASGGAQLFFQPRQNGTITVTARFEGDRRYGPAEQSAVVTVAGARQLYNSTAGVRAPVPGPWLGEEEHYELALSGGGSSVPLIGPWLLEAVLAAVWFTYLGVMLLLGGIAREGARQPGERRSP